MVKPIWLLDVDGVLNAIVPRNRMPGVDKDVFPNTWDDWRVETLNGYNITWSPQLMDRINHLIDEDLVEVRWLTTWGELANKHLCTPMKLPNFVVSAEMATQLGGYNEWWKLPAAQMAWEEERPMIWTDDDIEFFHDSIEWLEKVAQGSRFDEMLAITPRPQLGITPEQMSQIENFCEKWANI